MNLVMNELAMSGKGEPDDLPLTHLNLLPASLRDEVLAFLATHQARGRTVLSPLHGSLPAWKERRVKELIEVEISGKLPVQRLATECGLSIRHFTRAFRQSTGLTPHRYLVKLRVQKACELLLQPTLPLHEIATTCGFADQSHFTRVFSAAEKMSPGAWRRLNLLAATPRGARTSASVPL